jgi:hypothetical protein
MAQVEPPEEWTVRLAGLLGQDLPLSDRNAALQQLARSYVTGEGPVDTTRKRILDLLRKPSSQAAGTPQADDEIPPAIKKGMELPVLCPLGIAGAALVAIDHPVKDLSIDAIANWTETDVQQIVLVDCGRTAPLRERLTEAGLTDPRLLVIRLDTAKISWAQAFNIGLRCSRHSTLWAVMAEVRFGESSASLSEVPIGGFVAGSGMICLRRADVALAGGFNEYLETDVWGLDDLTGRLLALGLQRHVVPADAVQAHPEPVQPPLKPDANLRDRLMADPAYLALQNRFLAATMPEWRGENAVTCICQDANDHDMHLTPPKTAPATVPLHFKTEAARYALIDLMRQTLGGVPEVLRPRQMDLVLNRPVSDVTVVDLAVAAGKHADLVGSRKAWGVVEIAADALPVAGTSAAQALETVANMVWAQGQTLVLRAAVPEIAEVLDGLTSYPAIPHATDTTAFFPMELRELARPQADHPPRHATMEFNAQIVADLQHLHLAGPAILIRRPKIFVDAQHGLGNRLRAIASAGAIATASDRELIIIWQPDAHCACTYEDVFFPHGAVLSEGFVSDARALDMDVYNYMEVEPDGAKDTPIVYGAFRDIYLRSAYPFVSRFSNWHTENAFLRTIEHNHVVRDLVNSVRNPNDLSIHVRMEGGLGAEHLPYESSANWTPDAHEEIDHWRKRSHFRHFLPRLEQLIDQGLADKVFVASDSPAAYAQFQARYGDRISCLPRKAFDRSAESVVYAMADAILLGRAPRLLGSYWSSFSELAARVSAAPMTVELAGRDF